VGAEALPVKIRDEFARLIKNGEVDKVTVKTAGAECVSGVVIEVMAKGQTYIGEAGEISPERAAELAYRKVIPYILPPGTEGYGAF